MKVKTVILVDDDPLAILISKSLIEKSGVLGGDIQLKTFDKPREAIVFMEEFAKNPEQVAVLLLDINMPLMDGFQVLEALRQSNSMHAFKVIMLTSSIAHQDRERATGYSCVVDYFSKPLDLNKIAVIRTLLDQT
ncbi:MAG: response regulator [Mongoliitalea sp.]